MARKISRRQPERSPVPPTKMSCVRIEALPPRRATITQESAGCHELPKLPCLVPVSHKYVSAYRLGLEPHVEKLEAKDALPQTPPRRMTMNEITPMPLARLGNKS